MTFTLLSITCVVLGTLASWMWFMGRRITRLTHQSSQTMEEHLQRLQSEWRNSLVDTQRLVGDRLEHNATAMAHVREKLGQLEGRSQQILDVGKEIASFQDLLRAPKARGGVGEWLLGQLLAELMPRDYFEEQYTFPSGECVDAVIKLGGRLVPIDAKFPLESFQRLVHASDAEQSKCRREFERAVRTHFDAIAKKYIRPDDNTYDFALMFIPAEHVYYETIVRQEASQREDLMLYALRQRVIPVSPNTFFAYLQVILLGLRGLSIERQAEAIMHQLAQLRGDYERVMKNYGVLGKHLKDVRDTFDRTDRSLERLGDHLLIADAQQETTPMEVEVAER